jgi:hypothetical protein
MEIKNFKKIYPYLLQAKITPRLVGHPGIGKTQVVKQLAKELDYNFIYLTFGAVEDVGDIIGLQDRIEINGVTEATRHLRPEWFPTLPRNIIFLDEFSRAPKSVVQAMLPFILDGKLHTHQLPEDTHIVLADNPPTDDHILTDTSDKALASRVCHIMLEPSVEEFLDYAKTINTEFSVTSFISENPEMLESKHSPYSIDFTYPNRRAYLDFISPLMKLNPPKELLFETLKGLIGTAAALKFIKHQENVNTRIRGLEILNGYDRVRVRAVAMDKNALDQLNIAGEDLIREIKLAGSITEQQGKNIGEFLLDIPEEYSYSLVRALLKLGFDSVNKTVGENDKLIKRLDGKLQEILNSK